MGVSRRRVEELVRTGVLHAERGGWEWVLSPEAVRRVRHNLATSAGRPMRAATAWTVLTTDLIQVASRHDRVELDSLRRRLRARARHLEMYIHPSLLEEVRSDPQTVVGGRDAAEEAGVSVGTTDEVHAYVTSSDADRIIAGTAARLEPERPDLHLHVVTDDAWPFAPRQRFTSPWIAWLDLEDERDRAAQMLLEALLRQSQP